MKNLIFNIRYFSFDSLKTNFINWRIKLKSEFLFWKNFYLKIQYFKKEENGKLDIYKISLFIIFSLVLIFGLLFPFLEQFKEFRMFTSILVGVPIVIFLSNLENIFFKMKIKNNILLTKENEKKIEKIEAYIDICFNVILISVILTIVIFLISLFWIKY